MDRIGPGAKLARYLRRQTDVMDFWEVEDDWPRGPYVAIYLKGDPARHRAGSSGSPSSHAPGS